tara:strand:- start:656 stop:1063 length:408 start_codon:yes stop_codon:yes gene_type:complete
MIKLKDLLASSSQKGHISQHHPAQAFAPAPSINENKIECPQCKGKGCDHCGGKGYHLKENADEQLKAAEYIFKSQGESILQDFERMCKKVEQQMGNFMYPGFKAALHDAIIKSIKSKKMIDSRFIIKEMKRYFSR